eukprot:2169647-Pyramimonas_sp.AAC.1
MPGVVEASLGSAAVVARCSAIGTVISGATPSSKADISGRYTRASGARYEAPSSTTSSTCPLKNVSASSTSAAPRSTSASNPSSKAKSPSESE